ncbi:beta-channel forming cytolysin [Bacillus shihchuchen]
MSGSLGLQATSAFADSKGTVENLQNGGKVYNSFKTTYDMKQNIKNSIKVSFIEDPYADKKIAIVTTDGSNIDAKYTINGGYYNAGLKWPSAYHTEAEITSGDSAQFHKAAPVNTMTSAKVTSEVGYTLGGSVKVGVNDKGPNADASITGSFAWKESVSYDQVDYKTVLETHTDKKLNWKVGFQSFNYPEWGIYNRDSFNTFYGNQLFMKSRSYNEGTNNFVSKDTYNEFFTNNYKLDWKNHQVTLDNQKALVEQMSSINNVNNQLNKGKGKLSFSMNGNQLKATSSNAGYGISYEDKNWGIFVNGEKVYTFNEKTTVGNISNDINKLNIKGPYIEIKQI